MRSKSNRVFQYCLWILMVGFVLLNTVAFFHAWKLTHYGDPGLQRTRPQYLTPLQKIKRWVVGIDNPRPIASTMPSRNFETVMIKSNRTIECWKIEADSAVGTIILFHGFNADKSHALETAEKFLDLGYNTLLVDFMGSGGSEGNQTTLGYLEAEQVRSAFVHVLKGGERRIFLFGTSLGAAAIMKAVSDYDLDPEGIILEAPFGSAYQAVCARFHAMSAPCFPMAGLLIFWGSVQNNSWLFALNPVEYAKSINSPVLLMYGAHHNRVSRSEIDEIFANLPGRKELIIYNDSGNEIYRSPEWVTNVSRFLSL